MTKQELQKMVYLSVKKVFKDEIKPLIEVTIKKEFNKILNDAETAKSQKNIIVEEKISESSLMNLINEDKEIDSARSEVNERIFKGKNPFADVLNQTANDVKNREGVYANPLKQGGAGTQKKVIVNQSATAQPTEMVSEATNTSMPSREQLAAKMGYGNIEKIGTPDDKPGIEKPVQSAQPVEIELPEMSAGGEGGAPIPIDYNKVPMNLVQNMMKDYRGVMEKVEEKVKRPV
jgi:hypothetical protein